jgi:hypothetical protein
MTPTAARSKLPSSRGDDFDAMFDSFVPSPCNDAQKRADQIGSEVRHATIEGWLATLPAAVRPYRLISKLDRVALVIIERWDNRSAVLAYLDDLLLDETAIRMWMAPEVVAELLRLATYLRASRIH